MSRCTIILLCCIYGCNLFAEHEYSVGALVNLSKRLTRNGIVTPVGQHVVQDFKIENNTNIEIVKINDMWVSSNNMQYIVFVRDDPANTPDFTEYYVLITDPSDPYFNRVARAIFVIEDYHRYPPYGWSNSEAGDIAVRFSPLQELPSANNIARHSYNSSQYITHYDQNGLNRFNLNIGDWIYLWSTGADQQNVSNPSSYPVRLHPSGNYPYSIRSQRWYQIMGFYQGEGTGDQKYILLQDPETGVTWQFYEYKLTHNENDLPVYDFITSETRGQDWQIEYPATSDGYNHDSSFKRWYIKGGNIYDNHWGNNINPDHPPSSYSHQMIFGKTSYVLFYNPNTQVAKYYIRFTELDLAGLEFIYRPQLMFPNYRHRYNQDRNVTKDGTIYEVSNVDFTTWHYYLKSFRFILCLTDGSNATNHTQKIELTLFDLDRDNQNWADQEIALTYQNVNEQDLDNLFTSQSYENLYFSTTYSPIIPVIGADPVDDRIFTQYNADFLGNSVDQSSIPYYE